MSAHIRNAPRALITNAEQRSVLATCRCLADAGYYVSAVAFARRAAAHRSRSCEQALHMTDPSANAELFVEELADRLRREHYDVLIPGSDTALLAISSRREQIDGLSLTGLPAPEVVGRSLNREVLSAAATAAGLAAPEAVRCESPEQALLAARELGFPALVKSIDTALWAGEAVAQGTPSSLVADEHELMQAIRDGEPLLIQGLELGEPYSFGGVMIEGRLVALSMSHYRRTWPPAAGYAAFAETVDPPRELEQKVESLMHSIGWEGLFELELIGGPGERFAPIDLNPRPYGSIALAISAGVPLPAIWCRWLLQGELPAAAGPCGQDRWGTTSNADAHARETADRPPLRAVAGYGYRWEDADLRNVAWRLRKGRISDAIRTALPRRHVTHAYFRLRDPLPLAVRVIDIASNRTQRAEAPAADAVAPNTQSPAPALNASETQDAVARSEASSPTASSAGESDVTRTGAEDS